MKCMGYIAIMNGPGFCIIYPNLIVPTLIILAGAILAGSIFIRTRSHDAKNKYARR